MSNEAASPDDSSLDQRFDRFEREMVREDALEMAAFRRLLHGLSNEDVESDPVVKVDIIIERLNRLDTEIKHLRAQLRAQRN